MEKTIKDYFYNIKVEVIIIGLLIAYVFSFVMFFQNDVFVSMFSPSDDVRYVGGACAGMLLIILFDSFISILRSFCDLVVIMLRLKKQDP